MVHGIYLGELNRYFGGVPLFWMNFFASFFAFSIALGQAQGGPISPDRPIAGGAAGEAAGVPELR